MFLSVHQALFSLVDLFFGAAAVALLVGSWRRTQVPRVRQQLGAITVGLVSCLVLYAFATTIPTLLGRPLERERGERRERFELADRPQPLSHRRAVGAVPSIDRHRELRPQQQDVGERPEHEVVRRVEPRHQRPELRDPF